MLCSHCEDAGQVIEAHKSERMYKRTISLANAGAPPLAKQTSTDAKPHLLHAVGTFFGDLPHHLPGEIGFGFAPADEGDEVAQSSLANLYLPALRLLLTVRCGGLHSMPTCLVFAKHLRCALVPLCTDRPARATDMNGNWRPSHGDVRLHTLARGNASLLYFSCLCWLPPQHHRPTKEVLRLTPISDSMI